MDRDELNEFKSSIDLREYAAAQGYELSKKESWRGTSVMRHPATHDKIVIKRGLDGHYVFFSVKSDCAGTIVDLVQFLKGYSLGAVRRELRPWIGQPPIAVPTFSPLVKTEKDRAKVEAAFARMQDANTGHAYLENERALPASLLALPRFEGRIRIDVHRNAVFPHYDADGLCGYELKNTRGFTGFAPGGKKALWLSHEQPDDRKFVICESALDSLSHAVLFPDEHTRYASVGGKVNPQQPELIRAAIARLPHGAEVIAAMDADEDGRKLNELVRRAFELTGRGDLRFRIHEPEGFKDWNDQLRQRPLPFLPYHSAKASPG